MSFRRIVGVVLALALFAAGVWIAAAGMGYVGGSGDTSRGWAEAGAIIAGLGVALGFVVVTHRDQ